jgi:hypothetical protein
VPLEFATKFRHRKDAGGNEAAQLAPPKAEKYENRGKDESDADETDEFRWVAQVVPAAPSDNPDGKKNDERVISPPKLRWNGNGRVVVHRTG